MAKPISSAPSNSPASQLSPPTLHWGTVGPDGDTCDLCRDTIKPYGDCFISVRRAFEIKGGRLVVETEPITVLMCVACGWTRPYAPVPREGAPMVPDAQKPPHKPASEPREALDAAPDYYDAGVMGDPRD